MMITCRWHYQNGCISCQIIKKKQCTIYKLQWYSLMIACGWNSSDCVTFSILNLYVILDIYFTRNHSLIFNTYQKRVFHQVLNWLPAFPGQVGAVWSPFAAQATAAERLTWNPRGAPSGRGLTPIAFLTIPKINFLIALIWFLLRRTGMSVLF